MRGEEFVSGGKNKKVFSFGSTSSLRVSNTSVLRRTVGKMAKVQKIQILKGE